MNKVSVIIYLLLLTTISSCKPSRGKVSNNHISNIMTPEKYVNILGKGLDVDWVKTTKGIENYNSKVVKDFKQKGFSHVRIRIKNAADEQLLNHLDHVVEDCLREKLIPIIAYQGNDFKNKPTSENLEKVVDWWKIISNRYKNYSELVSFDILIEVTSALNKESNMLNDLYEKAVSEIRNKNPTRIIFISPRVRSSPEYLSDLVIPTKHNNFLMVEWHFYAAGPSKTNKNKLWTTGTNFEKKLISQKIKLATDWQKKTKIFTWVGAWMPGNYNKENNFSIAEQVSFANFVSCELDKFKIPYSVNSDTKFYNRETNSWLANMEPVLKVILNPDCEL